MRLFLLGFGVVGQSFARLLQLKEAELTEVFGMQPRIVCVMDGHGVAADERGLGVNSLLRKKRETGTVGPRYPSAKEVIARTEADVMIETTPTNFRTGEPGLSHVMAAFQAKMSVITTNKGPLAVAFHALHELARHNNVFLRFSGAVGGGTPILDFGKSLARGDTVTSVDAILNSTTNYILTHMEGSGSSFAEALKLAQKEGYAETDPSLDVDGYDSTVKLVIIANYLLGQRLTVGGVSVKGIRDVTIDDIEKARARGKAIRLIAHASAGEFSVSPTLIDRTDPLCISGPLNAVKFSCEYSGDKVIVGKGAGGMETASSVLRDLVEIRGLLGSRLAY